MAKATVAEIEKWQEPRFKLFYESRCHILAMETIPSTKEIEALLKLEAFNQQHFILTLLAY